ncbi:Protein CBR-TTR-7 [Caenorhabditis briggsae]|uniref:Protein CBR-TTR-7 n=1 Tax=Caenorhabditis briggsae TaxID=6238 RepID=A8XLJ3_CAEBR|nr:Protein CBR-TTR-7 [Caenorhabditis briggsae]CAP33497.1 Protein CBR-TTR-7 [Caenorhabditis briggsae]
MPSTHHILLAFCLVSTCQAIGRTQSTAVEVSPDELMDSAKTDANGHFRLSGTADEISGIDPKINIYHDCDDGIKPCQRRITIFIPSKYVSNTKQPSETFNLGRLQLAGKYDGESRDCLH